MITIHTISIGQPQAHSDAEGAYRSSIFRLPVSGPVALGPRGLQDDQVTDTVHHGSPGQAVCCHALEHHAYWNQVYGLEGTPQAFAPGCLGENWTLANGLESEVCVGDVFAVGTAQVQVSGPRYPCHKQDRRMNLPDLSRRAMQTLRTGFYLAVLQPGVVQAGDALALLRRPHPDLTLQALNRCAFETPDPALIERFLQAAELAESWKKLLRQRLPQPE